MSGSVPVVERPAGAALFARLKSGDIIIAAKLDRLFRSALDALQVVEELKGKGVKLHLLDLGGDIAGNGLSKLFLTIAAAFAEAERDRIRERISQVKADQRQRGRFLGGSRPFGYRSTTDGALVEDAAEQAAIRKAEALRKDGLSLRAIAETLGRDGFTISHAGVKKVLSSVGENTPVVQARSSDTRHRYRPLAALPPSHRSRAPPPLAFFQLFYATPSSMARAVRQPLLPPSTFGMPFPPP